MAGTTQIRSAAGRSHREAAAVAVFGTWMICGLFLDGWAHEAEKPETFFSPWHGILYSGFVAAVVWFAYDGWRFSRTNPEAAAAAKAGPSDRVIAIGLIVFIVGAVGDGLWHEIFGIEVNVEALVSPSHLALFIGGFLMVTSPLRIANADPSYTPTTWREWFPQGVTLTLAAALVLFFTQYASVFQYVGSLFNNEYYGELRQIADLASILMTNAILALALMYALWRWRPPLGAFTVLFGACGVLLAVLEGFDNAELIIAFVVGGVVADLTVARRMPPLVVGAGASFAMWCAFFALADRAYGVAWSPELWAGAIVLATASSALLAALTNPGRPRAVASTD
jgi:hypothetical protein